MRSIADLADMAGGRFKDFQSNAKDMVEVRHKASEHLRAFVKDLERIMKRKIDGLILGWPGPGGEIVYLTEAWNMGNLTYSPAPEFAYIFANDAAIEDFINDMQTSKGKDHNGNPWPPPITMMSGRKLVVYRVRVEVVSTGRGYQIPGFAIEQTRAV